MANMTERWIEKWKRVVRGGREGVECACICVFVHDLRNRHNQPSTARK